MKQTKKERQGTDVIKNARECKEKIYKKLQNFGLGFEFGLGLGYRLVLELGLA